MNPVISQVGTVDQYGSSTRTVFFPSTLKAGEGLLIFLSGKKSDSGIATAPTLTNFTKLASTDDNSSSATANAVYYKIATATDVSTGSISVNWSTGEIDVWTYQCISIRNAPPVERIQVFSTTSTISPFNTTGFSTMYANSLLFAFSGSVRGVTGGSGLDAFSLQTDNVTFTEILDGYYPAFTRCNIWTGTRASSNATGNLTWTFSSSSARSGVIFIAIAPIDPIVVTTQAVSDITSTTATANGNLVSIGAENAYQRGVAYMTASSGDISFIPLINPSFEDATLGWAGAGTLARSSEQVKYGTYSMKVTWTSGGEAYGEVHPSTPSQYSGKKITFGCWVWCNTPNVARLFIHDYQDGTYTENGSSFHTGNGTWQFLTVTATLRSAITDLIIRCRLSTTSANSAYFDGGIVAYHANAYPSFAFDSGDYSTGAFTKSISGLTRTTDYRVTSFATNKYYSYYGSTVGFKTLAVLPTVTSVGVNSISQTSFIANGTLTDDGGETCEIGFVWGTSLNPTIADNKVIVSGGLGAFSTLISGLTADSDYHVRSYATNSIGTSYGADIAFSTISSGPMIKRRVSFLSKAQSLTIQLSNNAVDETFTVLQFAVAGEKEDKKTYTPSSIISIN